MPDEVLRQVAKRHDTAVSQRGLAWPLQRILAILPIPGTSSLQHFEENMKATELALSNWQRAEIKSTVASASPVQ
jgi:pyridoxine 4-dehydrogenase